MYILQNRCLKNIHPRLSQSMTSDPCLSLPGGIYRVCDGWRKGNGLLRFEDVSESDDESDELEDVAVDSSELHEVVGNVDEVQGDDPREVLGQFFCVKIFSFW